MGKRYRLRLMDMPMKMIIYHPIFLPCILNFINWKSFLGQIVVEFCLSSRPDAEMSSFFKHSFLADIHRRLFNGCQRLLYVVRGNFMLFEALKYLVSAPAIDFKFTTYIGLGKSHNSLMKFSVISSEMIRSTSSP